MWIPPFFQNERLCAVPDGLTHVVLEAFPD